MAPAASSSPSTGGLSGNFQVVAWDLDTTGRRLIDEICQIGGFYVLDGEQQVFSQYVMPYKNPNPGARRSFGIKVVSVGRYRMLKDLDTGKILKTKSEVSALTEFIDWLKEAKTKSKTDGVILACHEPNRKVLIPLLLEALYKYNLMSQFTETVVGFINGVTFVKNLAANQSATGITSHSLRSLCKTVLSDTNPTTASASDRSKVLIQILGKLCCDNSQSSADSKAEAGDGSSQTKDGADTAVRPVDSGKVKHVATSVSEEEKELQALKGMLDTQGTLRPIFESQLRQKRTVRERAMMLRRLVAESGLNYQAVKDIYQPNENNLDGLKATLSKEVRDANEK